MIPYSTQCIEEEDIQAVTEALKKEYLTGGPTVNEFEEKVAQYVGAKYAVAVSSGTAALHAACAVIGIQKGDEVITTPNTWISSANAVLYCGGRPVFADIDPDTYNIDPCEIENKISRHTKAIIAVHYGGQPCDMERIHEIAKANHLTVIEDAAHAIGAVYKEKKIGSLSDLTVFSFHPVKQMTTCEGGMITTNNRELYEQLKLFRAYGMVKTEEKILQEGPWFSEQMSLGYNYRLSDVQCALGISQIKKLDRLVARRQEIAKIYDFELQSLSDVILPKQSQDGVSAYHLYPIQVPADKRKKLYMQFREEGIGVGVHYYPVYKNSYYQQNGYDDVYCKASEQFYQRELTLPAHYKVSDNNLDYIIEVAKKLLK
ncbi:MAG: UDP-4-amino-4,6-dideoxy-N-acetyl-beta-L-altrosamine transaminase [Lachnospiraceae bacterium]|nr:UDP-4-amino-4,6-dideoxy-N-acetyl-beta-L-altrosamine transaminase [Lachnospiraceae bacterium]